MKYPPDELLTFVLCSGALEADKTASEHLHGEYHQDKRALRGARASTSTSAMDNDSSEHEDRWEEACSETSEEHPEDDEKRSSRGERRRRKRAITLSSLPRGYWATLFNLEVVKARNRPIEPPKKPPAAPFFLATVHKGGDVAPSFPEVGTAAATVAAAGKRPEGETCSMKVLRIMQFMSWSVKCVVSCYGSKGF